MLVSKTNAGLGNRIKGFASALRIDPTALIYWPNRLDPLVRDRDECFIEPFEELFAGGEHRVYSDGPSIDFTTWRWYATPGELRYVGDSKIDFKFGGLPAAFISDYSSIFAWAFSPSPRVREIVDSVDLEGVEYGLHIRTLNEQIYRGGLLAATNRAFDYSPALNLAKDGRKKFVCCDCDAVAKEVAKYPGVRMIPRPAGESFRQGWSFALADMFALAQCRRIIGSPASTFVECAFAYSGFQSTVTKWGSGQ